MVVIIVFWSLNFFRLVFLFSDHFFCETKILHFSFTLLIRSFWFETKNERNLLRLVDDQIYTVPIKKSNVIPIQFIRFYSWNQRNKINEKQKSRLNTMNTVYSYFFQLLSRIENWIKSISVFFNFFFLRYHRTIRLNWIQPYSV